MKYTVTELSWRVQDKHRTQPTGSFAWWVWLSANKWAASNNLQVFLITAVYNDDYSCLVSQKMFKVMSLCLTPSFTFCQHIFKYTQWTILVKCSKWVVKYTLPVLPCEDCWHTFVFQHFASVHTPLCIMYVGRPESKDTNAIFFNSY